MTRFEAFAGEKYLNLESYRKNGVGVRTPLWFAAAPNDPALLYVYSAADAGKAKRIRRESSVRIAPCGATGHVTGAWIAARATIVGADEYRQAMGLLNRKYRPMKQILDFFGRFRPSHRRIVIALRPA